MRRTFVFAFGCLKAAGFSVLFSPEKKGIFIVDSALHEEKKKKLGGQEKREEAEYGC